MKAGQAVKRVTDIDPARRDLLNSGTVQAATLTECLAVDFAALMRATCPDLGQDALAVMEQASSLGISRRMSLAARMILAHRGFEAVAELGAHPSDTVRAWACFVIGADEGLTLAARLDAVRPFADDPHFGVREWSWLALRPHITAEVDAALTHLVSWTGETSERLRRFASEATRPRGVWCSHLAALRHEPERALPILEPLRDDPATYVQDSVGNWLNDASKDRPDWVRALCAQWSVESPKPATARICKRALRTINRNG